MIITNSEYINNESIQDVLERAFRAECLDRARNIDPAQVDDWRSLATGWAVSNGLSPECSVAFATKVAHPIILDKTTLY